MLCNILVLNLLFFSAPISAGTEYDNRSWQNVLHQYVDADGYVDYQSLISDRAALDRYLDIIKAVGPESSPEQFPTDDHQLTYYINAYNALVFEGVLSRGPETKSIWRGLISGLNFFVRMDVMVDGRQTNLRNLENDIIRDRFKDPRIHAALNCASISCPRLPQQSFTPESLQKQLDQAIREFVNSSLNVRPVDDEETVHLSEIFDWFEEDFIEFEKANGNDTPSLIDYINRYRAHGKEIDTHYDITFIKYNKGINSIDNKPN